jgi:hypothetical protein
MFPAAPWEQDSTLFIGSVEEKRRREAFGRSRELAKGIAVIFLIAFSSHFPHRRSNGARWDIMVPVLTPKANQYFGRDDTSSNGFVVGSASLALSGFTQP